MKMENVCEHGHGKYNHRPSEHSDHLERREPARQGRCKLVHGHSSFYDRGQVQSGTCLNHLVKASVVLILKNIFMKKLHTVTVGDKDIIPRFVCNNKCLYFAVNVVINQQITLWQNEILQIPATFSNISGRISLVQKYRTNT